MYELPGTEPLTLPLLAKAEHTSYKDPSIKALRDGLHNVRLTDSTASSAQYRARYRDEQIELAMEKYASRARTLLAAA